MAFLLSSTLMAEMQLWSMLQLSNSPDPSRWYSLACPAHSAGKGRVWEPTLQSYLDRNAALNTCRIKGEVLQHLAFL